MCNLIVFKDFEDSLQQECQNDRDFHSTSFVWPPGCDQTELHMLWVPFDIESCSSLSMCIAATYLRYVSAVLLPTVCK